MINQLKDSGYSSFDFVITECNSIAFQNLSFFIDKKIGVQFKGVNDGKNKDLFDLINVKISNEQIEFASPEVLNKSFIIEPKDVGRALAILMPNNFLHFFNFSFSYDN
ncbi:MAG: hypothetical protein P1P64_06715 [Treponemataceae bacterium]